MPTYKHPCPYCGKFIDKIVAACPFCGQVEPFSPKRCANCSKIIEDPAWVVCPSCGTSLLAAPPAADPSAAGTGTAPAAGAGTASSTPASPSATAPTAPAAPPSPAAPPTATQMPAQMPVPAATAAQGAVCGGCGAPLPSGARFCAICGTLAS